MGLYGVEMKPMYGAAAMALSSFFVCMNALRLNLVDPHDAGRDRKKEPVSAEALAEIVEKHTMKEEKTMTKTLKVEGMMCMHCEARVKKALEAVAGVESAVADHVAGTAVVTLSAPVEDEVLRAAVEAQDYAVLGVE
jgi:Cu2+-exporting ATPase